MKTNRASALSMVLLLVIPTLVALTPSVGAAERVGNLNGDTPVFLDDVATRTTLWLRDINNPGENADRRHGLSPVEPPTAGQVGGDEDGTNYGDDFPRPRSKTYQTVPIVDSPEDNQNLPAGSRAIFAFDPWKSGTSSGVHATGLRHDVTIRGANAINVQLYVQSDALDGDSDLTWRILLRDPQSNNLIVARNVEQPTIQSTGGATAGNFILQSTLTFDSGNSYTFAAESTPTIEVVAFASQNVGGVDLNAGTWTLFYDEKNQAPSRVELATTNALKVATWTQNRVSDATEEPEVTTLFRNWTSRDNYRELVNENRYLHVVDGWFQVRSAFGLADLNNFDENLEAEILKDQEPIEFRPWKTSTETCRNLATRTTVPMVEQKSDDASGLRTWRFQRVTDAGASNCLARDWWHHNYTTDGIPAGGEYYLRVEANYRQSNAVAQGLRVTDAFPFHISNVAVALDPFSYVDDATGQVIAETTTHQVAADGSTTFLLKLTNDGGANDTIEVTVNRVAQSPLNAVFTAEPPIPRVGDAQQVGSNLFRLGPGNSTILSITVRAPADVGASATFAVTAKSTLDPNADNAEDTLILNVGPTFDAAAAPNIRGAGLIVGEFKNEVTVQQGAHRDVSVFVWNRGVLPADINVNLTRPDTSGGWNATLVDVGSPTEQVTVRAVPAGGLSGASIRFRTDNVLTEPEYTVNVRAGLVQGATQEAVRTITGIARTIGAFEVDILEGISNDFHWVEVTERGTQAVADPDYVNGTYYRVWITNNQAGTRTYTIRDPSINEYPTPRPNENPLEDVWRVTLGHRTHDGRFIDLTSNQVQVESGRTLELYAWVYHNPDSLERTGQNQYADITFTVVPDEGDPISQSVRVHVASATGVQPREVGTLIEPVAREPVNPADPDGFYYVERAEENTRRSVRHVEAGDHASYRFRVTNGASWWTFTDTVTNSRHDHRLFMELTGVATDEGWSAYWRINTNPATNPPTGCDDPRLQNENAWYPASQEVAYPPLVDHDNNANTPGVPREFDTNGRASFWDAEVEVIVCPPSLTSSNRPAAGEADEMSFIVTQRGPGDVRHRSIREFETVIANVPDVTITPRFPTDAGHFVTRENGGEAVIPVFIANNGSYLTNVTLEAVLQGTGWVLNGNAVVNLTPLRAYENRTIAFRVKAPGGGASSAAITFQAHYPVNLYDPRSELRSTEPVGVDVVTTTISPTFDMTFRQGGSSACVGSDSSVTCTAQLAQSSDAEPPQVAIPLRLQNTGVNDLELRITSPTMPGWVFASPQGGSKYSYDDTLTISGSSSGGATVSDQTILVRPPKTAFAGSVTDIVITAYDATNDDNTRTLVARVVVAGGVLITEVNVERTKDLVERDHTVRFPITIRNDGNVDGTIRLTTDILDITRVDGINDARLCQKGNADCWTAWIESVGALRLIDENGTERVFTEGMRATSATYFLHKGEAIRVNLTVYAPFFEQENAHARAKLVIRNASSNSELGGVTVTGEIQDYGVDVEPAVEQLTLLPGLAGTLDVRITNTGDGNDTVNMSVDTQGLPWQWRFSSQEVFLSPGTTTTVKLTLQSPVDPLPTPRTAKFFVYMGTRGGQDVNVSRYDFEPLFVTIPQYRQLDVDLDNITELAVDENRDPSDGYEKFVEYANDLRLTQLVERAQGPNGKYRHFLDIPTSPGNYDGVADVYWDPDENFVTAIDIVFDLDKEGTPDYLLDTDGDGVLDTAYQSAARSFLAAEPIHILADRTATQYLIDQSNDGKPNKYFDPATGVISRVVAATDLGANMYGIDMDDDGVVDGYYNTRSETWVPAAGVNLMDLAGRYWYLFAGFLAVVALFGIVLVRRRAA